MSELSQIEADHLITMTKRVETDAPKEFPVQNQRVTYSLISENGTERFLLDINRVGTFRVKISYQNRYKSSIILVRLDVNGRPHINPDGERISGNHVHLYREGYGTRFAYPAAQIVDPPANQDDPHEWLYSFADYIHVVDMPTLTSALI